MTPAQRAVLLAGLPDAPTATPSDPPDVKVRADDIDDLWSWAERERLTGLLVHALEIGNLTIIGADHDGVAELTAQAHRRHLDALRISLAAEAAAVETIEILRREGIDAYAFKGVANAHLDYPDPARRTFNDADLHVRRAEFGRAIDVLGSHGYTRTSRPMPGWWERRYARAAELRSPNGVEVDLHAAIATGYFGVMLDHDALRADPDTFDLAGTEVHAFGTPARAVIAAYAIVLSRGPILRLQLDAANLFPHLDGLPAWSTFDPDNASVVVSLAREQMRRSFEGHRGAEPLQQPVPLVRQRRALALADRAETIGWSADARSSLLAMGWTDRLMYVLGIAQRKAADLISPTLIRVGARARQSGSRLRRNPPL